MPLIHAWYNRFRQYFSGNFPRAYVFCNNRKSVIKFFVAGCLAGGTDLIFLFLFHGLLGWHVVAATTMAFILSFLVSFTLQKFWTFRNYSQDKMFIQLTLYVLNVLLGLYLNGLFMHILVTDHNVWYLLAQIIVNLALGVWNFIVYKFIVFKNETNEINCQ